MDPEILEPVSAPPPPLREASGPTKDISLIKPIRSDDYVYAKLVMQVRFAKV